MAVIAFLKNRYCLLGREYLRIEDDSIIGSHTPYAATEFPDIATAKATLESCFYRHDDATFIDDIDAEKVAFDNYITGTMTYRKFNKLDDLSRPYMGESKEDVLNWFYDTKILPDSSILYSHQKTWPNLYTTFDCLHDVDVFEDKTSSLNGRTFTMSVDPKLTFDKFKAEWELVVDKIEACDDQGNKIIDVFEHTCSSPVGIYAHIHPNNSGFSIGSDHNKSSFTTLESFFKYWQKNHYYEK